MKDEMKICFIGGGNMATALTGGLLAKGASASTISVVEPLAEARARLEAQFGVTTQATYDAAAGAADVVVLAVKPQQMRVAVAALGKLREAQLVISIAAGMRIEDISRWLGHHRKLVRCIPNTPALIGQGMTGLFALPEVGTEDKRRAEAILGAVGATIWVADETLIDGLTSLSGSGPAYVFYFIEAMQGAAEKLGFSEAEARKLALTTFRGSALLAEHSDEPPAVLRKRVTSKAGTTEAAIAIMDQRGVKQTIVDAVDAGRARSLELGVELGKD